MSNQSVSSLKPLAPGLILALLAISFGFLLGSSFGAIESSIKDHLRSSADAVFETVYNSDAEKRDAVVSKSWRYLKRAHLHGGAIGAVALASILLLGLIGDPGLIERITAASFGGGALLYSIFWLVAGLSAPSLGSTHAAKEALEFIAIPGASLCLLGLGGTLLTVFLRLVMAPADSD
ncbi:MAG: hypothetical protein GY725_04455 [bacterium]|nr:hypothetical protein [bacterium]